MKADNFTLQSYFDRIGYIGEPKIDIASIAEMMRCQLFSVPFENLDVQSGKIVSLVPEEIVDKIITRNRGGYCYEVNGLFAMALQELGIRYQFVAARPMFYPVRRPKTHMAVVIHLNDASYLCDLGFGSYGIRAPIPLHSTDVEIKQDIDTFMISKTGDEEYLVKALVGQDWANQYAFNLSSPEWIDFVPANYFNSTHPDTIFVQKLLVVLLNRMGRKILIGDVLKTSENGLEESRTILPVDLKTVLSDHFGLIE